MPLSRRALLLAATSLGGACAARGVVPSGAAPFLVWRDGAAALWRSGAPPLPLPAALATDPVSTAAGVWVATQDARLQRWTVVNGWQRVSDTPLPEAAHALAATADGQAALVACGETLVLVDAQGVPLRRYDGTDLQRRRRGRAAVLRVLPHRRSLLAAWPALGEWWEISLDPDAPPVFDGLVHDYRMGEGLARPGFLGVRRVPFAGPVPLPAFSPPGLSWVVAQAGSDAVHVVHLDVRRTVARLQAPGANAAGSTWHGGLWWLPVGEALWGVDPLRWTPNDRIAAPGAASALVSAGDFLWALVGRTLYRQLEGGWVPAEGDVGAAAAGPGTSPLWAPMPWRGVSALA